MENTVNTVERIVRIKKITGVDDDGVIGVEMTDGSVYGLAFAGDKQGGLGVQAFPPKGVKIQRPIFDHASGAFRGFAIKKVVE